MLALLFSLQFALADVVNMPPEDCPPGAVGTSGHTGEWCRPDSCESDEDCGGGDSCIEVSMCLTISEESCGGMMPETGTCTFTKTEVHGICESENSCSQGDCQVVMACANPDELVENTAEPSAPEENQEKEASSCGNCAAASADMGLGMLLLIAMAVVWRRND